MSALIDMKVEPVGDGQFAVVRVETALLAQCPDMATAERICALLKQAEGGEAVSAPPPLTSPAPVAPPEAQPEAQPEPVREAQPEAGPEQPETPEKWTGEELLDAFWRIEDGESIKDVAEDVGKSYPALRGHWAQYVRKKDRGPKTGLKELKAKSEAGLPAVIGETPLAKALTAIDEVKEQVGCRLCGRHFDMTPERQDLCARCAHEQGH